MDKYAKIRCLTCGESSYRVGVDGSVWSCRVNGYRDKRGEWRRLNAEMIHHGYLRVSLQCSCPAGRRRYLIHDLVLTAFVGPRPPGMVARHFPDRDPSNNAIGNLQWGTPKENSADRDSHGTMIRGSRSASAKLSEADVVEMRRLVDGGMRLKAVADIFGVHASRLSHIFAGRAWNHVGVSDAVPQKRYVRKVSDGDVAEMRRLSAGGMSQREIAASFEIDKSWVCRLIRGTTHG
jgi:hypothetical protein